MSALRRIALGFPLTWSHRRTYSFCGVQNAGAGPYYVEWDPGTGIFGESWTGALTDPSGVLLTGSYYHPIRIAQFALHRHAEWLRSGDERACADFIAQAAWLRDHQQTRGVPGLYRFDFPWKKYGAQPGWWSAMAQGEAISVLLRAERAAPGNGYAQAAAGAAIPFRYAIENGGVVWRHGDAVFFEEIANEHAPHVLNGCIFALWGIWELAQQPGNAWLDPLIDAAKATIFRWLHRFDTGWWTLYSLMRTAQGRPHLATLKYHQFHIAQMRVLAAMFDEPAFDAAADRWSGYVQNSRCRMRVLTGTMRSLPDMALGRDTVSGGAHT